MCDLLAIYLSISILFKQVCNHVLFVAAFAIQICFALHESLIRTSQSVIILDIWMYNVLTVEHGIGLLRNTHPAASVIPGSEHAVLKAECIYLHWKPLLSLFVHSSALTTTIQNLSMKISGNTTQHWPSPHWASQRITQSQYFTLPHGFQWTLTGMLEFHLESTGMVGIYHSARFQVHSAGFQGPFQHIPSSFRWIPTHSNPFQPISTHFMGHSNTFKVEFYSNGFQVPSKCHVT